MLLKPLLLLLSSAAPPAGSSPPPRPTLCRLPGSCSCILPYCPAMLRRRMPCCLDLRRIRFAGPSCTPHPAQSTSFPCRCSLAFPPTPPSLLFFHAPWEAHLTSHSNLTRTPPNHPRIALPIPCSPFNRLALPSSPFRFHLPSPKPLPPPPTPLPPRPCTPADKPSRRAVFPCFPCFSCSLKLNQQLCRTSSLSW